MWRSSLLQGYAWSILLQLQSLDVCAEYILSKGKFILVYDMIRFIPHCVSLYLIHFEEDASNILIFWSTHTVATI